MSMTVTPFLMFEGRAEEAMAFYVATFPDCRILDIRRYGPDEDGGQHVVWGPFDLPGLTGGTYKSRELGIDNLEDVP